MGSKEARATASVVLRELSDYFKHRQLTHQDVAKLLGYRAKNTVSNLISGNKYLSKLQVERFASPFPEINADFLMYGKGALLRDGVEIVPLRLLEDKEKISEKEQIIDHLTVLTYYVDPDSQLSMLINQMITYFRAEVQLELLKQAGNNASALRCLNLRSLCSHRIKDIAYSMMESLEEKTIQSK